MAKKERVGDACFVGYNCCLKTDLSYARPSLHTSFNVERCIHVDKIHGNGLKAAGRGCTTAVALPSLPG